MAVCSAFDLNEDMDSWSFKRTDKDADTGYFASPWSTQSQNNDYLFTPPLNLDDTSVSYEITYEAGNFSSSYKDLTLGVFLHDKLDPRDPVATIQETRAFNNTATFDTYTQVFAINKPGTYYISLFTDSPVYQTNLRVRNIRIRKLRTSTDLPVEVSNLKAVGAEKGELKVVADFDMPTKYISGNDIHATTDIDVKATIGENSVTATGHPGEHITLTVPSLQGTNQLLIQTSIDGLNGKETVLDVFTGVDVPGPVGSLTGTVSADNLTIFAKWTPPTEGENGYYIDPRRRGLQPHAIRRRGLAGSRGARQESV